MTMMTRVALFTLAAAAATTSAAADQQVTRPFQLEMDGAANVTGPIGCTFSNSPTGSGTASHLGAVTFSADEVITLPGEFPTCLFAPSGPPLVSSSFTLLGAGGEAVFGQLVDVMILPNADGSITAVGPYFITGGTGRFAGASGSGTWTVFFANGDQGFMSPGHVSASGTIAY